MENFSDKPFEFRAGNIEDITPVQNNADWAIVDIGFSSTRKSCGIGIYREGKEPDLREEIFSYVVNTLTEMSSEPLGTPLNLIIEAPLSASFNSQGNPTGRAFEKRKDSKTTRYWYVGAGSSVLLAALYLLKALYANPARSRDIRLFEGFVSFKENSSNNTHIDDVNKLWQAIQTVKANPEPLYGPFSSGKGDKTKPTLELANIPLVGTPPVVEYVTRSATNFYVHQPND